MMIGKTLDQRKVTIQSYADPPSQRFKLPSYLHLLKSSKTAFDEDFMIENMANNRQDFEGIEEEKKDMQDSRQM